MGNLQSIIEKNGFKSSGFWNFTPTEAMKACHNGALLLDVRDPCFIAFKQFDVPETIFCHYIKLREFAEHLPQNCIIVVADSVGLFSHEAIKILCELGFENMVNLAGGLVEWERDELPIKVDLTEQLSGSCVCQLRPRNKV